MSEPGASTSRAPKRLRSWGETSEASAGRVPLARTPRKTLVQVPASVAGRRRRPRRRGPHDWRPARFMVIAAHPDDAEFGPAGTAARWIADGSEGWLVCCTSGDRVARIPTPIPLTLSAVARDRAAGGGRDHRLRRGLLPAPARRRARQRPRPARAAGPRDPDLPTRRRPGHRPGGPLPSSDGGVNHTDHRAAGLAAVDAVYPAARNPMAFPWLAKGGLAAHRVRRLYLFWSNQPTVWVDISATIERKLAALARPREPDPRRRGPRRRGSGNGPPRRARRSAAAAAEALRVVVIDDDEDEGPGLTAGPATTLGQAPSRRSGRTRPQSFHRSASPSARRPRSATSSRRLRSPAVAGEVLVGGDRRRRCTGRPSRPRSATGGCASGRGRRSRARATGRAGSGTRSSTNPPSPSNR